jgi:hypothetical protein
MANWTPTESGTYLSISNIFANAVTNATVGGSGGLFIPYSNFASFDGSSNDDFREFVYSILDASYTHYADVNPTLTAGGSGLTGLTMNRGVDSSNLLADTPSISKTFNVSTVLNVTGVEYDVAEEMKP